MYADDVKIHKVRKSVEDSLSLHDGLPLAADKIKLFCIGNNSTPFEYRIGFDILERAHEMRDFGFRFNYCFFRDRL